ncbi:MAG: hypothetical protein AAGF23_02045 [Acidobacteriota bacterium]
MRRCRNWWVLVGLAACWASAAQAQGGASDADRASAPDVAEDEGFFEWGFEAKAHFRSSDAVTVGPTLDAGGTTPVLLETVEAGEHFEISTITLFAGARWSPTLEGRIKVDFIDRYERNPTSTDEEVDIDEAWLRFGRAIEPGEPYDGRRIYAKVGKFPHFERQEDRQLESYGLVSTTFNRLEDVGLELGADLGRRFYVKASFTEGNPVFFRDPNALAGDTGATLLDPENAELGGGLGLLYDADVGLDEVDFDHPEIGVALGMRHGDGSGLRQLDVLLWAYRRDVAPGVELDGSTLEGDLALLRGLGPGQPLPFRGDEKREWGANVWYHDGPFTFFAQYVDQELAELPRRGFETELSWYFELPLVWGTGRQQLFPSLTPVLRYSRLLVDFEHPPVTPLPSRAWDWYKVDVGLRLEVLAGLDLTAEYAFNHGYLTDVNEFLTTVRWRR